MQDAKAEHEYELWLRKRWEQEARNRGLTDPAAVSAFVAEHEKAAKAKANQSNLKQWPLAYRLHLKEKANGGPSNPQLLVNLSLESMYPPPEKLPVASV